MGWIALALGLLLANEVRVVYQLRKKLADAEANYIIARTIAAGLVFKKVEEQAEETEGSPVEVKREAIH